MDRADFKIEIYKFLILSNKYNNCNRNFVEHVTVAKRLIDSFIHLVIFSYVWILSLFFFLITEP